MLSLPFWLMVAIVCFLVLVCAMNVCGQGQQFSYETHQVVEVKAPSTVQPVIVTATETVHRTHPYSVRITSDVWVTETVNVNEVMTVFHTIYNYVPSSPSTVTSVIRVTSTPVVISTVEIMSNPTRTMTSVFTSFVTDTETITYWQSITHVSYFHQLETVPVWSTQVLIQESTYTVTEVLTITTTSHIKMYGSGSF